MIEPSVTYGNHYLDLTRELAIQFKSSPPPSQEEKIAIAATATPRPPTLTPTTGATNAPTPTRGPSPTPTATPIEDAAYRTTNPLRVHEGPETNAAVIGKLPVNFVLDVLGRSQDNKWLAIAYPDYRILRESPLILNRGMNRNPTELGKDSLDNETPICYHCRCEYTYRRMDEWICLWSRLW